MGFEGSLHRVLSNYHSLLVKSAFRVSLLANNKRNVDSLSQRGTTFMLVVACRSCRTANNHFNSINVAAFSPTDFQQCFDCKYKLQVFKQESVL